MGFESLPGSRDLGRVGRGVASTPMPPVPADRHLLRARDLIDVRYAEPLDLDALARAACVSRWHFVRSFRRAFGETPYQYLLTRRMERAAALLRTTDHSVARICVEVGFASVGSFTTSFKRDPRVHARGVPTRAPAGGRSTRRSRRAS